VTEDALKALKLLEPLPRWAVFDHALSLLPGDQLTVAETGVTTETPSGASILFWCTHPRVGRVHAIDIDGARFRDVYQVYPAASERMVPHIEHSIAALASLPNGSLDLLYLDSDLDPALQLHEFMAGLPKLRAGAAVVVDDVRTKAGLLRGILAGSRLRFGHAPYGSWSLDLDIDALQEFEPKGSFGLMVFRVNRVRGFSCGRT
jgi:hypothetical protein